MSRYDYADPGHDPEYCNPLSPWPDEDVEVVEHRKIVCPHCKRWTWRLRWCVHCCALITQPR